jgi:signal transduction histidine kinase
LLAIVLPAAVVAVLGYLSLRQLEASAELLFREQARDVVVMAAEKIEAGVRRLEDEALARLEATLAREGVAPAALDRLGAEAHAVGRFALLDRAGRVLYPPAASPDADGAVDLLGEIPPGLWERRGRRELLAGDRLVLAAVVRGPGDAPLLAAVTRDVEGLRRHVFAAALDGLEASTCVAVIDHRGRAVYAPRPLDGTERLLTVAFRDRLPSWGLALHQEQGRSPRDSVRTQVRLFTAAFGVLLVVIVAGVVATARLVRRETEMARLKSDLVANVSHDLRTPLSVIRMFGETLELGRVADPAVRQEYYRVITREAERLSRLIDNVLDFSRIESGRRTYDPVPTAVEPLVRETLDAFAYPLAQQGFQADVRVAPDLPEVRVDPAAVGLALANLLDNAIKYSGERKVVRVDVRRAGEAVAVSVEDEGVGIPGEEQARIFEKFYRVGRSDTQGRRGSGVGLALVRHVAEAHGGRVTVESRPGQGSRFTLWLPAAGPPPGGAPWRAS